MTATTDTEGSRTWGQRARHFFFAGCASDAIEEDRMLDRWLLKPTACAYSSPLSITSATRGLP